MADLVIIHTADKQGAAERLREAAENAGYSVSADAPVGEGAESAASLREQVAGAKAAIVVWSKAAMASDAVGSAVEEARRRGRLIEASADGIMPVDVMRESDAALISGWRGEPWHPGWQKIAVAIERLCGAASPRPAAPVTEQAPPAVATAPQREPKAASRLPALPLLVGLALLLLTGAAAAAWMSTRTPVTPEPVAAVVMPPEQPVPAPVDMSEPATDVAEASDVDHPAEAPAPEMAPPAVRQAPPPPRRTQTASARPARAAVASPRRVAQAAPREGQRTVRYRNSRTMRLFCERAGRNTPQCRTFRRSTGR